METGFVVLVALATLTLGVICGLLIEKYRKKPVETQGTIYAYYDDQASNPSLLLEQSVPIDDIASMKRVIFDVIIVNENSHK